MHFPWFKAQLNYYDLNVNRHEIYVLNQIHNVPCADITSTLNCIVSLCILAIHPNLSQFKHKLGTIIKM